MPKQLTITEARGRLMDLPEEFSQNKKLDAVEITRRGKPIMAIIPWNEYESFRETMEIVADAQMMASIRRGLEDARHQRSTSIAETRKELGI